MVPSGDAQQTWKLLPDFAALNPGYEDRLRIELGVPVQIIEPAVVQVVRREQPAVAVQVLHRGLERRLRRKHPRFVRRQVALAQIARRAGGDDVVPHRVAAARTRQEVDVYKRQIRIAAGATAGC